MSENEEDLLFYPKVVIKKETFTANHGSFLQGIRRARRVSQGPGELSLNTRNFILTL